MSSTTAETLRASSTDELNEKLREAKEELFNLRFQAEDGIRDQPRSRGLGDVYKRQAIACASACASAYHDMP